MAAQRSQLLMITSASTRITADPAIDRSTPVHEGQTWIAADPSSDSASDMACYLVRFHLRCSCGVKGPS
jgi:hypothetical protein